MTKFHIVYLFFIFNVPLVTNAINVSHLRQILCRYSSHNFISFLPDKMNSEEEIYFQSICGTKIKKGTCMVHALEKGDYKPQMMTSMIPKFVTQIVNIIFTVDNLQNVSSASPGPKSYIYDFDYPSSQPTRFLICDK